MLMAREWVRDTYEKYKKISEERELTEDEGIMLEEMKREGLLLDMIDSELNIYQEWEKVLEDSKNQVILTIDKDKLKKMRNLYQVSQPLYVLLHEAIRWYE